MYGIGDFGTNLIWTTLTAFSMFYFVNICKVDSLVTGNLIMAARFLDALSGILFGFILDRTRTRMGKARPWLFGASIPLGLSLVMVFSVPGSFNNTAKLIYIFIAYNLLATVFYPMSNISYNTMLSLVAYEQSDRTIMNTVRFMFGSAGGVAVNIIMLPLVAALGGGQHGWTMAALVMCVGFILINLMPSFGCKEKAFSTQANLQTGKVPFSRSIRLLFANKYWVLVLTLNILFYTAIGVGGVVSFYAVNVLNNENAVGIISLASSLPLICGMFFAPVVIGKLGKRKSCLYGMIISIVLSVPMLIFPVNYMIVVLTAAVRSLFMAPLAASLYALVADVVEYGEWKTGIRIEGMTYSAVSFGVQAGTGIGIMLQGTLLALGHYVSGAVHQSVFAVNMICAMYIYIPFIINIMATVVIYFLDIDKIYPQIMLDLGAKRVKRGNLGVQPETMVK